VTGGAVRYRLGKDVRREGGWVRKRRLTGGTANGKVEGGGAGIYVCIFRPSSVLGNFSEERKDESGVA